MCLALSKVYNQPQLKCTQHVQIENTRVSHVVLLFQFSCLEIFRFQMKYLCDFPIIASYLTLPMFLVIT